MWIPDPEKLKKIIEKLQKQYPLGRNLRRKRRRRKRKVQREKPSEETASNTQPEEEEKKVSSPSENITLPEKTSSKHIQPQTEQEIDPAALEPPFKGVKGVCVECGRPLSKVKNYFTCAYCKQTVCTDCERDHVAKCMYKIYGGKGFGETET